MTAALVPFPRRDRASQRPSRRFPGGSGRWPAGTGTLPVLAFYRPLARSPRAPLPQAKVFCTLQPSHFVLITTFAWPLWQGGTRKRDDRVRRRTAIHLRLQQSQMIQRAQHLGSCSSSGGDSQSVASWNSSPPAAPGLPRCVPRQPDCVDCTCNYYTVVVCYRRRLAIHRTCGQVCEQPASTRPRGPHALKFYCIA
jgi:hypothetical protein